MDIDPWSDFEKITEAITDASVVSTDGDCEEPVADLEDGEEVDVDEDYGIMPLTEFSGNKMSVRFYDFAMSGVDEDGDEWEGSKVYSGISYSAAGYIADSFDEVGVGKFWAFARRGQRPTAINSNIAASIYANWSGRPGIVNGDPDITNRTTYLNRSSGEVGFSFDNFEGEDGVAGVQFVDTVFNIGLDFGYWASSTSTDMKRKSTSVMLDGVRLYVNGVDMGPLTVSTSGSATGNGNFRCVIQNQTITFDSPMYVKSIEIRLQFTLGALSTSIDAAGGWGLYVTCNNYVAYSGARLFTAVDPSAANTGLLKSIIEWLNSILTAIKNVGTAIIELPGKIANLIIEGIKSLFLPDEVELTELKTKYETLLSERLGFVWQAGEWVLDFGQSVLSALQSGEEYVFQFPGISVDLPEGTFVIIPAQAVTLENPAMAVFRPVAGTVASLICVLAFIKTAENMVIAIVSGVSYFEFLKGGKGDAD